MAAPAQPPRILVASLRRLNPHAAWCSNYEFEDVVRGVDDVELLELEPGALQVPRQRLARSVAWRGRHPAFTRLNPGVRPVTLDRDYDVFAFFCMNVWDLLALNALRGWRERCRIKVCYMQEFYGDQAASLGHFLRRLGDFDHVFQVFSTSIPVLSGAVGRPCHHLPLATDVRRFTPFPEPPPRVIDVLSVGRRAEPVHRVLRRLAQDRRLFYVHDTLPGAMFRPTDPAEHRDMLAATLQRARLFVTYPAKFGADEHGSQSEVGARYFEGAAAGAVLLGQAPTAAAFHDDFPWPDAVVEARPDGSDAEAVVTRLLADPAALARRSARSALEALRRHDWGHRWQAMLRVAGVEPRPALAARLGGLAELAEAAGHRSPAA